MIDAHNGYLILRRRRERAFFARRLPGARLFFMHAIPTPAPVPEWCVQWENGVLSR